MQILEKGEWKKEKSIKGDLVQSKIIGGKKVFKLTVRAIQGLFSRIGSCYSGPNYGDQLGIIF